VVAVSNRIFETERLRLREFVETDFDDVYSMLSDPIAMKYYPNPYTREHVRKWEDTGIERYQRHGHGLWVNELKDDNSFVGYVGLINHEIDEVAEIEIGYMLKKEFWGKGYATEAAHGCKNYGFEILKQTKLVSFIDPANLPSKRVAERIGMGFERSAFI
jgi:ribosomal-protein-alanine N-acetyltransferase